MSMEYILQKFFEVPVRNGIYALTLLLTFTQFYSIAIRPTPLPEVIEQTNESVVAIGCPYKDGLILTSGFVSSNKGYVTTVAHGLTNCLGKKQKNLKVKFWQNDSVYHAKVVRYNKIIDVAVLYIEKMPKIPALQIAVNAPPAGTHVTALGHPHFLFWSAADGIVSADRWYDQPYLHLIQVSCPLNNGNSGGPVITDDGRVIGISTSYIDNPTLGLILAGDFIKLEARGLYLNEL